MKNTDDFNPDTAEAFALQIEGLTKENPELTQGEVLMACLMVIGDALASIQCRDCRRLTAKNVKKTLPQEIAHALIAPIRSGEQHVHRVICCYTS